MQSIISLFFSKLLSIMSLFLSFDKESCDILLSTWLEEEEKNIKAATKLKLG